MGDGAETHVNELENGVASCSLKTNQAFPVLIVVMLHSCHLIAVSQVCPASEAIAPPWGEGPGVTCTIVQSL